MWLGLESASSNISQQQRNSMFGFKDYTSSSVESLKKLDLKAWDVIEGVERTVTKRRSRGSTCDLAGV